MKNFLEGVLVALVVFILLAASKTERGDPPMHIGTYQISLSSHQTTNAICSAIDRNLYDVIVTNDTGQNIHISSFSITAHDTSAATYLQGNGYTLKTTRTLTLESIGVLYGVIAAGQAAGSVSVIKQLRE